MFLSRIHIYSIEEVKNRLLNIQQQKISEENVYQFLLYFDKLYDKFTDLEKKEFLNSFVEQVDIYEQAEHALCDGAQSLKPERFAHLMGELKGIAQIIGREM